MFAQVNYELTEREKAGTLGAPRGGGGQAAPNCVEINQCVADNSTLSHFQAPPARSSGEGRIATPSTAAWRTTR